MSIKFMNEVFDKHNVGQDYRDYIFEDTNNIPQYLVMWNWNDILKDLNKKIELTNKLMIRIYDLCIESAEIAGLKDFLHFELYNDKVESNYDKKRKLIFLKIVELLSLSKKAKIENILYYILKSDNAYGEATAKYLFNNYKKNEILNILDLFGFSYLTKELFLNLLKLDYDNYFDIFVKSFKKVDYSFKCLDIFLPIIKKEEELKDLIVFSLVKYFSSNDITYKGVKLKAKDIDILENVLSTNSSSVNDSKFNKLADKISKDLNKKNKDLDYLNFYCMWFENSKREFNDNFFKKLRDLFFAISPVGAISEYINQKGILAEKILTEYNVPLYKYLQFLIYETAAWNDCDCDYDDIKAKEGVENKLTSYIESNFNDFKQAFDLVNNDIKESVIRDFYDKNIIGFNNIIVELAPSTTSKAIKNLIVDILGKDNNNKEIVLNFLKEKKSHVREIAVMILTKWNLPNTQKTLRALLRVEKSKTVKDLIVEYLIINKEL